MARKNGHTAPGQTASKDDMDYELGDQVGFLLRLASQRHSVIFQANSVHNLTPTQFSALVKLFETGSCSQNELGRRTAVDQATIKGVVDRLKAKGLVELVPDPHDKRRFLVSVPEEFSHLKDQLYTMGHEVSKLTLQPLTKGEQALLLELLRKLS